MGGVVLEGCCRRDTEQGVGKGRSHVYSLGRSSAFPSCVTSLQSLQTLHSAVRVEAHLFWGVVLWCTDWGAGFGCRDGAGED